MPNVIVYRPGSSAIYQSDTPGASGIEWTFNARVDGRLGLIVAVFPFGTSEELAARGCKDILVSDPSQLEGII